VPRISRRSPRYQAFLVTGAVVGVLAAVVLVLGPGADVTARFRLLAYLSALLGGLGALLGGLAAVLVEARRR
jgi:ABC-type multidrug transport system permease subunit